MSSLTPQKPLRTALIGLSSSATTSWASTAHLPPLLTPTGKSNFTITALLNSSADAAKAAIRTYNLPAATKAYGTPEDLANDADVDVVVVNTRVDKHFDTVVPSLKGGKAGYFEWPIASNAQHIDELVRIAREKGVRVAVGLQGRWAPPVLKLRELVQSGGLGKVLSVDVRAYGGTKDREILPGGLKYFAERGIGGNPITIGFGHVIDFVQSVHGDLVPGTVNTRFQLQRPEVRIRDPETGEIVETVKSDVPDLLSLHGALPESPTTVPSATLTFSFRRGQPFPGTPSFIWSINFENGEVRLVSPSGISLQAAAYDDPVTIQIHHHATDKVEDVEWGWDELQSEVPIRARGVLTSLYSFADSISGNASGEQKWVDIEDAARRAAQIEKWLAGWGGAENDNPIVSRRAV